LKKIMKENVRNASERDVGAPHHCSDYFSETGVFRMREQEIEEILDGLRESMKAGFYDCPDCGSLLRPFQWACLAIDDNGIPCEEI